MMWFGWKLPESYAEGLLFHLMAFSFSMGIKVSSMLFNISYCGGHPEFQIWVFSSCGYYPTLFFPTDSKEGMAVLNCCLDAVTDRMWVNKLKFSHIKWRFHFSTENISEEGIPGNSGYSCFPSEWPGFLDSTYLLERWVDVMSRNVFVQLQFGPGPKLHFFLVDPHLNYLMIRLLQ